MIRGGFYTTGGLVVGETTDNFELGFKADLLDGRLQTSGAVFVIDYSDQQVSSIISAPPFRIAVTVPESEIKGAELDISYITLVDNGYQHDRTVHLGSSDPAHVTMPGVHRVASLLKRWLLGTHQGSVQSQQLNYYLDEFTFRFNRRSSRSRGLLFYRLLEQAVMTKPTTYRDIAGK